MYFFVLIVNPAIRPAGKPASKRQWPEKSIGLAVKVIINLSFSDTIFYLFALRKALPLNYFDQVNENEKIALAASAYTAWAPLSFAAWNTAAYPGVYFLPAPPSGAKPVRSAMVMCCGSRRTRPPCAKTAPISTIGVEISLFCR